MTVAEPGPSWSRKPTKARPVPPIATLARDASIHVRPSPGVNSRPAGHPAPAGFTAARIGVAWGVPRAAQLSTRSPDALAATRGARPGVTACGAPQAVPRPASATATDGVPAVRSSQATAARPSKPAPAEGMRAPLAASGVAAVHAPSVERTAA